MPDLEKQQSDFTPVSALRHGPKNPQDARIYHRNICVRCLYNIPQGTCMLALPGAVILMMGLIVLPWTSVEDGWSEGTQQVGLIMVVFGSVLFLSGTIYCAYYYRKAGGKAPKKKSVKPHPPKHHVELVGVYRKREDGMSVPAEIMNKPKPFVSTIS